MLRSLSMLMAAFAITAFVAAAPAKKEENKSHDGTVVSAAAGKLVMTGKDGKEHSHEVGATAKIMIDGKAGKLEDLKKGDKVTVTTDAGGKVVSITRGAAKPTAKVTTKPATKTTAKPAAKDMVKPAAPATTAKVAK